jgi:hypothetical protein
MKDLTPSDLQIIGSDHEPRIHDLLLAERLGYGIPREIRRLIDRNISELERYGKLCVTMPQSSGGRPSTDYHLNERQAILICMFGRTERAAQVREEIITVFMAWRHGQLAPVSQATMTLTILNQELAPIRQELDRINGNVVHLVRRVDKIEPCVGSPRYDFSEETNRLWQRTDWARYGGKCPVSGAQIMSGPSTLISNVYSMDHWYAREKKGLYDGWPVAMAENLKLRDAAYRDSKQQNFQTWCGNLREIVQQVEKQPKFFKPPNATITINDDRQLSLLDEKPSS